MCKILQETKKQLEMSELRRQEPDELLDRECLECGKPIHSKDEYCSKQCFNASML